MIPKISTDHHLTVSFGRLIYFVQSSAITAQLSWYYWSSSFEWLKESCSHLKMCLSLPSLSCTVHWLGHCTSSESGITWTFSFLSGDAPCFLQVVISVLQKILLTKMSPVNRDYGVWLPAQGMSPSDSSLTLLLQSITPGKYKAPLTPRCWVRERRKEYQNTVEPLQVAVGSPTPHTAASYLLHASRHLILISSAIPCTVA